MTLPDEQVIGVAPDISATTFEGFLLEQRSPAAYAARKVYDYCVQRRVSPSALLGVFEHESRCGKAGTATQTHSWGNTRLPNFGIDYETPTIAGRSGEFPVFRDWVDGGISTVARLVEHAPYRGKTHLRDIIRTWAPAADMNSPSAYATAVLARMADLRGREPVAPPGGVMEIIDVRDQLPTNPGSGSGERYANKDGVIVHYSGPPVSRSEDTLAVLRSYAEYHIGPYLDEAGIAYHYDIGNDARVRLVRDPDAVLWHCASWPENRTYYAVHVMIGDNQHASAAQLAALGALVDELRQRHGMARENVKGHQEVSATSCPGTLMADFVLPYRAGKEAAVADGWRFPETGKYLGGGFYAYWRDRGGLAVFGLPLTEEMDEGGRTVQYFERAVFEFHPENEPQYRVLLRRLGASAALAAGLSGPGIAA